MIKVAPEEHGIWSTFVYELTGIVLSASKTYLIENRLQDLLPQTSSMNFKDLYQKCQKDTALKELVINRISTQETSFFRDRHVFTAINHLIKQEIIPAKRKESAATGKPPRLRLWSAACSHGQEAYSTCIILKEAIPDFDRWDIQFLATDIADNAFRKASLARYSDLEVQRGLDQDRLSKYFFRVDNQLWQVNDRLRALMTFKKINLVKDSFAPLGNFDIVFCRNVAIYFDQNTKITLFGKLEKALNADGRLFIGATENITQIMPSMKPVQRYGAVYYMRADAATPAIADLQRAHTA